MAMMPLRSARCTAMTRRTVMSRLHNSSKFTIIGWWKSCRRRLRQTTSRSQPLAEACLASVRQRCGQKKPTAPAILSVWQRPNRFHARGLGSQNVSGTWLVSPPASAAAGRRCRPYQLKGTVAFGAGEPTHGRKAATGCARSCRAAEWHCPGGRD